MKFAPGDTTGRALAIAMQHEYLRCRDAFEDFTRQAGMLILRGQSRPLAYSAYNAYARFIHHLYEFLLSAIARERGSAAKIHYLDAEQRIMAEAQRAVTARRDAIVARRAHWAENDLAAYPETVPPAFARDFRRHRNIALAHVALERSALSLSDFYASYHPFLYLIYADAHWSWAHDADGFPDLEEITRFSVALEKKAP